VKRAKHDGHHHAKHSQDKKYAAKATSSEEKRSEKHASKHNSDSRKDYDDHQHKSKFHTTQTDKTGSDDSKKHSELNRRGTENRIKRKHADSAANSPSERESDSKQKQARTEVEQTVVQSKTVKQTVGSAFDDARARYLARKGKSSVPVICEDSE